MKTKQETYMIVYIMMYHAHLNGLELIFECQQELKNKHEKSATSTKCVLYIKNFYRN